jgi:phospholipid transport system transporter-binding protein
MSTGALNDLGEGRFAVVGAMSFETSGQLLAASKQTFFDYSVLEVDLSGVDEVDSAGLALLLEWVGWARNDIREIRFRDVPEKLRGIARISEVEELLDAGERWQGNTGYWELARLVREREES